MGILAWDPEPWTVPGDEKPAPGSKAEAPDPVESETGAVLVLVLGVSSGGLSANPGPPK